MSEKPTSSFIVAGVMLIFISLFFMRLLPMTGIIKREGITQEIYSLEDLSNYCNSMLGKAVVNGLGYNCYSIGVIVNILYFIMFIGVVSILYNLALIVRR